MNKTLRPALTIRFLTLIIFAALFTLTHTQAQDVVVWSAAGELGIMEKDGNNKIILAANDFSPLGLAINTLTSKLYWSDKATKKIMSSDLNGTNINTIHSLTKVARNIAIDPGEGKLYWLEDGTEIKRSDLDGSNKETLVNSGFSDPVTITLDTVNDKIYWADQGNNTIKRANLNGSSIETISFTPSGEAPQTPQNIAIDLTNNKIFWTEGGTSNKIKKADLNGNNATTLSVSVSAPTGIILNAPNNEMYWADKTTNKVHTATLDGNSPTDIATDAGEPLALVLDVSNNHIYFTEEASRKIVRTDLTGGANKNKTTIKKSEIGNINSMVFDGNDKIYINDDAREQIRAFQISTRTFSDLTNENIGTISGLALNTNTNELFWANHDVIAIQKRSVSSTGTTTLSTYSPNPNPTEIEIDPGAGKIYWTAANSLYKANLDGSSTTAIGPTLSSDVEGLDIDLTNNKIYWADKGNGKIQRADLDGNNVEDVLTGLSSPHDLKLDITASKVYWREGTTLLRKVDLTGNNAADVQTIGNLTTFTLAKLLAGDIDVNIGNISVAIADTFNFGTLATGSSKAFNMVIKNTSSIGWIFMTSATITGSNGFTISNSGSGTAVIPPNDTIAGTITFAPTSDNAVNDVLQINSNDTDETPYNIILTGNNGSTISVPDIDILVDGSSLTSNGTFDFGGAKLGSPITKTFTIKNSGGSALIVNTGASGSFIQGTNASLFVANTSSTATTINAGSTTTFTIVFTPDTEGTKTASFTITSNSPITSGFVVNLTGTGATIPTAPQGNSVALKTTQVVASSPITAALLTWTDNSNNEAGFKIERSVKDASNFQTLDSVATDVVSYADTTIQVGIQYYYRLKAFNVAGESAASNTFSLIYVGLDENNLKNIRVAPNPAQNRAVVKLANKEMGQVSTRIRDSNGKLFQSLNVIKSTYEMNIMLDISNLPVGIYLIEISTPHSRAIQRIIKH